MKRILSTVALLTLLLILLPLPALAAQASDGWVKSSGYWYYYADGATVKNQWVKYDGAWYYLGGNGRMAEDKWVKDADGWCYVDAQGRMTRNQWVKDGTRWCYIDRTGHPARSCWIKDGGHWYYLDDAGYMTKNQWVKDANGWCYVDAQGRMARNQWVKDADGWCYVDAYGHLLRSGWAKDAGKWCYLDATGHLLRNGWAEDATGWCYMDSQGYMTYSQWIDYEDNWYYIADDGYMVTGWQDVDGYLRYFRRNGAAAKGNLYVDGKTQHFSSGGIPIVLVNPWNKVPSDYTVKLTSTVNGATVAEECDPYLRQMLSACRKAGCSAYITSSYRSHSVQTTLYNRKVNYYRSCGYSYTAAQKKAAMEVAVPGTSEHQLGLAVDIVDVNYGALDEQQATMPAQQWLMENSWRYGFILRYPEGSTESTGIIYEPWHYRYVGKEVAREIHDSGLCLEDYLDMLTASGG